MDSQPCSGGSHFFFLLDWLIVALKCLEHSVLGALQKHYEGLAHSKETPFVHMFMVNCIIYFVRLVLFLVNFMIEFVLGVLLSWTTVFIVVCWPTQCVVGNVLCSRETPHVFQMPTDHVLYLNWPKVMMAVWSLKIFSGLKVLDANLPSILAGSRGRKLILKRRADLGQFGFGL